MMCRPIYLMPAPMTEKTTTTTTTGHAPISRLKELGKPIQNADPRAPTTWPLEVAERSSLLSSFAKPFSRDTE